MFQHSTLCFRKHSRHRFLVTAPSIHENNFVLTSVWKGGRRGGGRPEIDAGQSRRPLFFVSLTYFPDPDAPKPKPSGGPAAAAAARRPRTAPSSAGSLSEQSRTERKMRSDWEKTAPSLPPPDSGAAAAFHSRGKYVE